MNSPVIFLLFFPVMWVGILTLLSFFSGWRELAQYYPYQNQTLVARKHFQSASMQGVNYRSCLTVGASPEGLYFAPFFLFAVGSPKLFIPWSDISIMKKAYWGFVMLELSFVKAPAVKMHIFQTLEGFLREARGRDLIIDGSQFNKNAVLNNYQRAGIILAIIGLFLAFVIFSVPHR